MKRTLTVKEQDAVRKYTKALDVFLKAGDVLGEAFSGYKEYLEDGDFIGAKEFLRPMPDSVEKTLMFHHIIVKEGIND